jgi:precorrin-2/cobalt-factor-2 C20-methyltransferase
MPGLFYGIGIGPGDPELLTIKASRLLGEVDVVAVPVAGKNRDSTAFKIARRYINPCSELLALAFPMTQDQNELEQAWEKARRLIRETLDNNHSIAFITLGDPMLYSTYIYLYQYLLASGYSVQTVSGINSFSAAAAAAGIPLTYGNEKMAVLPAEVIPTMEASELQSFETLVIFKVARCFDQVVSILKKVDRLKNTVMVENCGQSGEKIFYDLTKVEEQDLSYFSLIISRKEPVN